MMTGMGAIATMVANPTKELHFAHETVGIWGGCKKYLDPRT